MSQPNRERFYFLVTAGALVISFALLFQYFAALA